jgi:hypothetical protein
MEADIELERGEDHNPGHRSTGGTVGWRWSADRHFHGRFNARISLLTGLEVPRVVVVTPDGNVYESKQQNDISLEQHIARNKVAMRNNKLSGRNSLDMFDMFQKPHANYTGNSTNKYEICLSLQDTYGKTSPGNLQRSRKGCPACRTILDALGVYSRVFDEDERVRIFAPIARGNTLRIWCQGKQSTVGRIPFMIELYLLPGKY